MIFPTDRDPIKNVFLYIRQSTDEAAKRQVRSLQDQQSECEALADRLGLNIVAVFREDQSAKAPHRRPIFKAMLKELSYKTPAKRRADGILAWHPDRLSRNALEAGMIVQMIDDELIKDMFFPAYSFHNDASGKEHLFIEFARAKGYSDHLSVSVKRGTFGREREGAMVYPPKFGYQKKREVPENPALCSLFPIPCPINFPIVVRIFELRREGYSLASIETSLFEEGLVPKLGKLGKSRIGSIASDPFYFGRWFINKGKSNERIVEMATICLPDGTRFEPILTEVEFWDCQSNCAKTQRKHSFIRHVNPFPVPVVCERCQAKMRPCWKRIKRAGGRVESQLGYECQSRHADGSRCKQPRLKAELLYNHIADALQQVTIDKKHYQRFLIGSEAFIKRKTDTLKRQRTNQTKAVQGLRTKKLDLLRQKAVLAENGSLEPSDKKLLNQQLLELGDQLSAAEYRHQELAIDIRTKTIRFKKFIELSQSLHENWLKADLIQKQKISEKILLNLTIENREIRSQTWTTPFQAWLKSGNFLGGRGELKNLEPYFNSLWTALIDNQVDLESWEESLAGKEASCQLV